MFGSQNPPVPWIQAMGLKGTSKFSTEQTIH